MKELGQKQLPLKSLRSRIQAKWLLSFEVKGSMWKCLVYQQISASTPVCRCCWDQKSLYKYRVRGVFPQQDQLSAADLTSEDITAV